MQKAFDMYQGMGEIRSLTQVAIALSLPAIDVRRWSAKHKWNDQIALKTPPKTLTIFKSTQDRVVEKTLKAVERQVELVKMKQDKMTREDPAEPGKQLPTEDLTIYALKETGSVLLNSMKTLAEALGLQKTEKEIASEGGSGGNGKGSKTGVLVNVIFRG
jgi:hypothetical protein